MVKFALRSITKLVLVATALASAVPGISGAEDFSKNSKEPPRRWLSNDNCPHNHDSRRFNSRWIQCCPVRSGATLGLNSGCHA